MVNVKKVNVGRIGMRLVTGYMFLPFINPRDYSKGKKIWKPTRRVWFQNNSDGRVGQAIARQMQQKQVQSMPTRATNIPTKTSIKPQLPGRSMPERGKPLPTQPHPSMPQPPQKPGLPNQQHPSMPHPNMPPRIPPKIVPPIKQQATRFSQDMMRRVSR